VDCKRCGDWIDSRWGNDTYCGQCLNDTNPSKNGYRDLAMECDREVVEGSYEEALRAYVPGKYRMCVEEEM
jgi:hypothetical protein